MSQLYDLKIVGGETIEITEEQKKKILSYSGTTGFLEIGDSLVRTSAIMAIVPSKKDHPKFKEYVRHKNNSGSKISFETYLDEINYPRQVNNKLGDGNE